MRFLSKSEIEQNIIGAWKSELEEMIYVFSDTPSVLKKDSFDLLVSNIKLNNYFLTMYCIVAENENMFIEIGNNKSCVKYVVTDSANNEIHLENSDQGLLILKKL
ncbi:MAG TPA: hypothetical protein VMH01_11290 [Puia sp.]|nr:hypothetical protein [Puia sp.]